MWTDTIKNSKRYLSNINKPHYMSFYQNNKRTWNLFRDFTIELKISRKKLS